ncbi:WcaI family glycosyltransferase [Rhizobium sp. CRIBSB]|nr:WcaI family glycosyltransferase [Rhizobium sp. CRIBSB]
MRILIYGMNHAPEFTGVGRYTGEIAAHLAARGHEVRVVTAPPHYPGWRAGDGYSARRWTRETLDGATVWRCPLYLSSEMRGIKRLMASFSFALSSTPVVLWQALTWRPQVILTLEPTLLGAPAAILAAKATGARLVLQVQDLEVDAAFAMGHLRGGVVQGLADLFEKASMGAFDRVITISNRMAERIAAKGVRPDRIDMIRNWVDVTQIKPLGRPSAYREELGLGDRFVALYAGALGAKQGVNLLIKAAQRLAGRSDVVMVVAGDGPMRSVLEEAALSAPNLMVLPFQPEARFAEFLGLADVHLLPQERGAADLVLPSKLGGMLASGRPILVTADPGTELADFLTGAAVCTPPGDIKAMADGIGALADARAPHVGEERRLELARSLSKSEGLLTFEASLLGQ